MRWDFATRGPAYDRPLNRSNPKMERYRNGISARAAFIKCMFSRLGFYNSSYKGKFQEFRMSPPSEQANGISSQLTATTYSSGQQNGDMSLTVLGCGEYVPISQPRS